MEILVEIEKYVPRHDKANKMSVRPAKTQLSLGIRPVWSESSLCAQWVAKDPVFLHVSEDSDQTGRMPRLIWVFTRRTVTFLVLSCSYIKDFLCSRKNGKKRKKIKRQWSGCESLIRYCTCIYFSLCRCYSATSRILQDSLPWCITSPPVYNSWPLCCLLRGQGVGVWL